MTNEQIDKIIANLQAVKAGKKIGMMHGAKWFERGLYVSDSLSSILECVVKPDPPNLIERWLVIADGFSYPYDNEISANVMASHWGGRIIHMREVVEEKPE